MKQSLINVLLILLAICAMSCLISLMAVFMGGGKGGGDLLGLIQIQVGMIPIALVAIAVSTYLFISIDGWSHGFRKMWQATPQWMVFIFLSLNSLAAVGEVALVIVMRATEQVVPWYEHAPLACMFLCSLAFLFTYAKSRSYPGSEPAMSGRWP